MTAIIGNRCFSPLFVGAHSSTIDRMGTDRVRIFVSVPSSSGRTLQRCSVLFPPRVTVGFQSPLRRGALFNLFPCYINPTVTEEFHAPLGRGALFILLASLHESQHIDLSAPPPFGL